MKRFLPFLLLLVLETVAFGDGVVIPPTAFPTEITIPDQRALIHFADGTERLVIETRFAGAGSNFVWVVPLPSEPKIEEATTGVFSTLGFLLQPKVIHNPTTLFPTFIICLIGIYLLVAQNPGRKASASDFLAPTAVSILLGLYSIPAGLIALALVFWGFHEFSGGKTTLLGVLVIIFFLAIVSALFLPALSGGVPITTGTEITQLDRKHVGAFEVTTVTSRNPTALLDWLRNNGFEAPAGAPKIIHDYVRDGWVFSLAKLRRENAARATNTIHPLSFTFKTTRPVYPMRLTSLGTKALNVDLYVFGSERARARHFKVEQCAPVVPAATSSFRRQVNELPLTHPLLKQWLHGSTVVTKLSADLMQRDMENDVQIEWESFSAHQSTLYSHKGAALTSATWASGLMLLMFIAAICFSALRSQPLPLHRMLAISLAPGLVVFLIGYLALPQTAVRTSRMPRMRSLSNLMALQSEVHKAWDTAKPASLDEARSIAAALNKQENVLLGGPIREEDSPGNYVVRPGTNGFQFVWFGMDGSEDSHSD